MLIHVVGPVATTTQATNSSLSKKPPAHGDGESQRFNLLAVQQVIDHDAAVPPGKSMGK